MKRLIGIKMLFISSTFPFSILFPKAKHVEKFILATATQITEEWKVNKKRVKVLFNRLKSRELPYFFFFIDIRYLKIA